MGCGSHLVEAQAAPQAGVPDDNPWLVEPEAAPGGTAETSSAQSVEGGGDAAPQKTVAGVPATEPADAEAHDRAGPPPAPVMDVPEPPGAEPPAGRAADASGPAVAPAPTPAAGTTTSAAVAGAAPSNDVQAAGPGSVPDDPHNFAAAAMRLGPSSRHAGFPALAVAAISLHDEERVQVLVQGVIGGLWGVALLTDERLLLVTPRLWVPDRITVAIDPDLTVRGWAEGPYASLTFDNGRAVHMVEQITDTILAVELANRLRAEVDKRSRA
jgi:hypothetical protein